jgi:hypothetical protein
VSEYRRSHPRVAAIQNRIQFLDQSCEIGGAVVVLIGERGGRADGGEPGIDRYVQGGEVGFVIERFFESTSLLIAQPGGLVRVIARVRFPGVDRSG